MSCLTTLTHLPSLSASPLRRSGSYLSLSDLPGASQPSDPYASIRQCRKQGKQFEDLIEVASTSLISHEPASPTRLSSKTSPNVAHQQRTSSPLVPIPETLPSRPAFPRSKPEPDLHNIAIKAQTRSSREGQKTFYLGSPLVASVWGATKELEGIVATRADEKES